MTGPACPGDCSENIDPRKLVRDGTQPGAARRGAPRPGPRARSTSAGRSTRWCSPRRTRSTCGTSTSTARPARHWQVFFASDLSAQLAVAAIEDVAVYRTTLKALLRALEDPELPASAPAWSRALGAVFDCLGTLALRLDDLATTLPPGHSRSGRPSAT